ncbi:Serine proteases trypsin domain [Trinorchestia longiramus]|nr:Serine proteases trypsin domain [Trinorchestia longiramus]
MHLASVNSDCKDVSRTPAPRLTVSSWPAALAWFSFPFSTGSSSYNEDTQFCGSTSDPDGLCIGYPVCVAAGGQPDLNKAACALLGYCCRFTLQCGSRLEAPVGFWQSPRYPAYARETGFCGVTISPIPDALFVRVEFLDAQLTAPDLDTCAANTLTIYGQQQGHSSTICGALTNYKTLVRVGYETRDGKPAPRDIQLLLSVRDPPYKYNIKLTQILRSQVNFTDSGLPDIESIRQPTHLPIGLSYKVPSFAASAQASISAAGVTHYYNDAQPRSPAASAPSSQSPLYPFQNVPITVMDEMGNKLYSQALKMDLIGSGMEDQDTENEDQQSGVENIHFFESDTSSPPVIKKDDYVSSTNSSSKRITSGVPQITVAPTNGNKNDFDITRNREAVSLKNTQAVQDSTGNQLYFSNQYSLFSPSRRTNLTPLSIDSSIENTGTNELIQTTEFSTSSFHLPYYPSHQVSREIFQQDKVQSNKLVGEADHTSARSPLNNEIIAGYDLLKIILKDNKTTFEDKNVSTVSLAKEPTFVAVVQTEKSILAIPHDETSPEKPDSPNSFYLPYRENHLAANTRNSINALAKMSVEQMLNKIRMKQNEYSSDRPSSKLNHQIKNDVNIAHHDDSNDDEVHNKTNDLNQTPALYVKKIGNRLFFLRSKPTDKPNSNLKPKNETFLSSKESKFETKKREVYSHLAKRIVEEVKKFVKNPLKETSTQTPLPGAVATSASERKENVLNKLRNLFQKSHKSPLEQLRHFSATSRSSSGRAIDLRTKSNIMKHYLQYLREQFVNNLVANSLSVNAETRSQEEKLLSPSKNNLKINQGINTNRCGNDKRPSAATLLGLSRINELIFHESAHTARQAPDHVSSVAKETIQYIAEPPDFQLLQSLVQLNKYDSLKKAEHWSEDIKSSDNADAESLISTANIEEVQSFTNPEIASNQEIAQEHHERKRIQEIISENTTTKKPQILVPIHSKLSHAQKVSSTRENAVHNKKIISPHPEASRTRETVFKHPKLTQEQESIVLRHGETQAEKPILHHEATQKREFSPGYYEVLQIHDTINEQPNMIQGYKIVIEHPLGMREGEYIVQPPEASQMKEILFENLEATTTQETIVDMSIESTMNSVPENKSHPQISEVAPESKSESKVNMSQPMKMEDIQSLGYLSRPEPTYSNKNLFAYSNEALQLLLLQHELQQAINNHILGPVAHGKIPPEMYYTPNASQVNVRRTGGVVDEQKNVLFGSSNYNPALEIYDNETDYSFLYDALTLSDATEDENESHSVFETFHDFPKPLLPNTNESISSDIPRNDSHDYDILQYPASQILPEFYDHEDFINTSLPAPPPFALQDNSQSAEKKPIGAEALQILTQFADLKQDLRSDGIGQNKSSISSVNLMNTSLSDLTPSKSKVILQLVLAGESEVLPSSINREVLDDPPVSSFLLINFPNNPVINITTAEQADRNITIVTGKFNETFFTSGSEPSKGSPFTVSIAPQFEDSANIFKVGIVESSLNNSNRITEEQDSIGNATTSVSTVTVRNDEASVDPDSELTSELPQSADVISSTNQTTIPNTLFANETLSSVTLMENSTISHQILNISENDAISQGNDVPAPVHTDSTDNSNDAESSGTLGGIPGISLTGSLSIELSTGTLSSSLKFRTFSGKGTGFSRTGSNDSNEESFNLRSNSSSSKYATNETRINEKTPSDAEEEMVASVQQTTTGTAMVISEAASSRENATNSSSSLDSPIYDRPEKNILAGQKFNTKGNIENATVITSSSKILTEAEPLLTSTSDSGLTNIIGNHMMVGDSFDLLQHLATMANISVSSASNISVFRDVTKSNLAPRKVLSNVQESRESPSTIPRTMSSETTLDQVPKLEYFAPYYVKPNLCRLWVKPNLCRLWVKPNLCRLWVKPNLCRLWVKPNLCRLWVKPNLCRLWVKPNITSLVDCIFDIFLKWGVTYAPPCIIIFTQGTVMSRNDAGDHNFCSAALISSQYSLTAASCVLRRGYAEKGYSVRVFYEDSTLHASPRTWHNLWSRSSHVDVVAVTFHPMYDHGNFHYDIAVLTHAQPVLGRMPLALPSTNKSYEGTTAAVMGHSLLRSLPSPHSSSFMDASSLDAEARFLPSSVLSNIYCRQRYSGTSSHAKPPAAGMVIRDEMLCVESYTPLLHTCQGDRGGPVVFGFPQTPVLIGIVSGNAIDCGFTDGTNSRASGKYPDVAVRITEVLDFIYGATAQFEFDVNQQAPSSLTTWLRALG